MNLAYAGIGSRTTPENIQKVMSHVGRSLAQLRWTLRTGGAQGADEAFLKGFLQHSDPPSSPEREHLLEVYIPWDRFQGFSTQDTCIYNFGDMVPSLHNEALNIAEEFHPNWGAVNQRGRSLHARNCFQILGPDLQSPSEAVICWTLHGQVTGGTGQALRIAEAYDIPIINLGKCSVEQAEDMIQDIIQRSV